MAPEHHHLALQLELGPGLEREPEPEPELEREPETVMERIRNPSLGQLVPALKLALSGLLTLESAHSQQS